jgi:hypothetical protein
VWEGRIGKNKARPFFFSFGRTTTLIGAAERQADDTA